MSGEAWWVLTMMIYGLLVAVLMASTPVLAVVKLAGRTDLSWWAVAGPWLATVCLAAGVILFGAVGGALESAAWRRRGRARPETPPGADGGD